MEMITRARTHLVVTLLNYFAHTDAKINEYSQTAEKLGLVEIMSEVKPGDVMLKLQSVIELMTVQIYWEYRRNI